MACPVPTSPCNVVTLAKGPITHVQHCPRCGVISLHFGATTIRLEAAAFEQLWGTLGHALRVMRGLAEPPPDPSARITSTGGNA